MLSLLRRRLAGVSYKPIAICSLLDTWFKLPWVLLEEIFHFRPTRTAFRHTDR